MNKVIIIGRNTKDIELRQTPSGTSAVEFSIAVKRTFKNANGEYESDFLNCVAFRNTAELISRYVGKGDMLAIVGRLQTRSYTNKEGRKVYVTEIVVDEVEFLQTKKAEQTPSEPVMEEADPFQPAKWEEINDDGDLPF